MLTCISQPKSNALQFPELIAVTSGQPEKIITIEDKEKDKDSSYLGSLSLRPPLWMPKLGSIQIALQWAGYAVETQVSFESIGDAPEFDLVIKKGVLATELQQLLLGREKNFSWFQQMFNLVQSAALYPGPTRLQALSLASFSGSSVIEATLKLKVVTMLMNLLVYRLIKMHPAQTVVLIRALLTCAHDPLAIARKFAHVPTIVVGFPLLIALWDSFRSMVENLVHFRMLVDALLEEQLRVFHYCAKSIRCQDAESLKEFMTTHAKRWQVTMFLLCDLPLFLSPSQKQPQQNSLISSNSLHFIFKLGHYLEWEGTTAHDLGKWPRDLALKENNSYLFWLKHKSKPITCATSPDSVKEFLADVTSFQMSRRHKLLSEKHHLAALIHLESFLSRTIPLVQLYYKVDGLMTSPKM